MTNRTVREQFRQLRRAQWDAGDTTIIAGLHRVYRDPVVTISICHGDHEPWALAPETVLALAVIGDRERHYLKWRGDPTAFDYLVREVLGLTKRGFIGFSYADLVK